MILESMEKINLITFIFATILFFTNSLSAMPRGDDGKPLSTEEMKKAVHEAPAHKKVEVIQQQLRGNGKKL